MKLHGRIFVPLPRADGYYWNVLTQTLFSTKRKGLNQLRYQLPSVHNKNRGGYQISIKGTQMFVDINTLKALNREPAVALVFDEHNFDEELFTI